MPDTILKPTVEYTFQIAKKRTRILAFIIDFFIYCIIGMILGYFFGEPVNGLGFELHGASAFLMMLIGFFLWPISEGLWGQTIGKRILNIKVLTDGNEPIEITAAIGRFLLGFVDYIFLIGIIIAATNKKNKRIGDMVANTIVVQL